jgi:hypothetical protein
MQKLTVFSLRMPADLRTWLAAQSELNVSSLNAEILRAIRERMTRENAMQQPRSAA